MPTPNWGPRAGQVLNDQEMDAYLQAYPPPGTTVNNVNWGGDVPAITLPAASDTLGPAAVGQYVPGIPQEIEQRFAEGANQWSRGTAWDTALSAGPAAATPITFNTVNQDQARLQQDRVIQDLQRSAAGDLNSQAQQQLGQQYGAARNQQSSIGSSIRGQGAGAAQRNIQQGQQDIQRGFAGDQQMLMLQEQQAAQQMLAQIYAQQHGQDINQAQSMSELALGNQAMNQDMAQFYMDALIRQKIGNAQYNDSLIRNQLGLDLDNRAFDTQGNRRLMEGAAEGAGTAVATLGSMYNSSSNRNNSGYRQVDGQNSIVPYDDK